MDAIDRVENAMKEILEEAMYQDDLGDDESNKMMDDLFGYLDQQINGWCETQQKEDRRNG